MGKKQHQKDKLYITNKEWKEEWGGKKSDEGTARSKFRRLPFNCCSLTFQPADHPLCTKEGVVFELLSIVPYLKKYGMNPVNGDALNAKDLVKLNFSKNNDGKIHCPVTFKIFTENSHIVAIKPTGNVYSYEAVQRLNLKAGNFKDLLNDQPFARKDIITIQDPTSLEKFNISTFHHVQNQLKVLSKEDEAAKGSPMYTIKKVNAEMESTLSELATSFKESKASTSAGEKETVSGDRQAHYSTGAMAGSFTSTSVVPQTKQEAATIDKDVVRYSKIKAKAYVRIETNFGDLNIELHSDQVPKTCENFIILCKRGYYNNTTFHRLIKNFMIQGGDPTGTGKGGDSMWGKPFEDEFKSNLVHQGRGILSMANSGKDTNKSQFFITFRSCRHLDNKHSVFGRIVGGMDTLRAMEEVETNSKDEPVKAMTIVKASVFIDPFEELDKEEERLATEKEENKQSKQLARTEPEVKLKVHKQGIGKYIAPSTLKRSQTETGVSDRPNKNKKSKIGTGFGNFDAW